MYCSKCGAEIMNEAFVCPSCGCLIEDKQVVVSKKNKTNESNSKLVKVFMIIGCVLMAYMIIPLIWTIPMTVVYFNKVKNNKPVGTGFKVCTLLFVSFIAGIIMLCE